MSSSKDVSDSDAAINDQSGANTYEKQLDDIINRFLTVIPIIAFTQDLSYMKIVIILIPIIIMLVKPIIIKYILKKKKTNNNIYNNRYIYRFSKLHGYGRNYIYEHLESYLDHTLKIMNINHCYSDESEYNTDKPKFLLPYDQQMNLEWNGHMLIITKYLTNALSSSEGTNNNKNKIPMINIMTQSDLKIIDQFLEEVQKKQQELELNKTILKNQIMIYDQVNIAWKPRPVKIKKDFANTFLKEKELELIQRSIKYFNDSELHYDNRGIPYKISYLLHGKPGCGKTSFIYAVARETGRNIYLIPRILDEDKLQAAITLIPDGSVVVAEEIDTIEAIKSRDKAKLISNELIDICGSSMYGFIPLDTTEKSTVDKKIIKDSDLGDFGNCTQNNNKTAKQHGPKNSRMIDYDSFNSFSKERLKIYLDVLDGYDYFRNCIIIMTTNHLNDIDEAVYRPGRVDHKIEFTTADQYQIKNIFKIFYNIDLDPENLDKMAKMNKTTSYIINTAINPNLNDYQKAIDIILEHTAF